MTAEHQTPDEHGADVIPLRAEDAHTETGLAVAKRAAYLDATGTGDARRLAIIPAHLQRARIAKTAGEALGLYWYKTRFHAIRVPVYAILHIWYAFRGTGRLTGRVMTWWHWTDGWLLESMAVAAGRSGHHDAMNAHREGKKTRTARGQIIAASVVAALVLLLVMVRFLPWWGWLAAAAIAVRVLARHGAPDGQKIMRAAVVPTAYQPPTPEVITRALGSLNIAAINAVIKDGPGISFVNDVHRDGDGWGVDIDLPHGVTASDIIRRREALASGLRRPHSATWPEAVPAEHAGRLSLWVWPCQPHLAPPSPLIWLHRGERC